MAVRKYTLVVKIGGTEGVDFSAICQDAAALVTSDTSHSVARSPQALVVPFLKQKALT